MRFALVASAFAVGLGVALHLAMNAAVGATLSNPRVGNAVFWCVGALAALIVGATGWRPGALGAATRISPWLWTAGAIGACLVFGIASLIPRLGAGTTNVVLLCGQVIGGLLIAQFGLLGSPVEHINGPRVVGVVLMVAGGALAVLGKWPLAR
jgi:bacterial/archaeal transporter family-2 protein